MGDIENLKIETGLQILEMRLLRNVTQAKLARLIGTEQPSIARVERGAVLPSLSFMHKIAVALKTELIPPKFAAVEESEIIAEIDAIHADYKEVNLGESSPLDNFSAANGKIENRSNELQLT